MASPSQTIPSGTFPYEYGDEMGEATIQEKPSSPGPCYTITFSTARCQYTVSLNPEDAAARTTHFLGNALLSCEGSEDSETKSTRGFLREPTKAIATTHLELIFDNLARSEASQEPPFVIKFQA